MKRRRSQRRMAKWCSMGPDGVDCKLTPEAAAETSHRLLDAAKEAAGQRRAKVFRSS